MRGYGRFAMGEARVMKSLTRLPSFFLPAAVVLSRIRCLRQAALQRLSPFCSCRTSAGFWQSLQRTLSSGTLAKYQERQD